MKNIVNLIKLQYNSLLALKKILVIFVLIGIFFAIFQPSMITFAGAMFLMFSSYSLLFYEEKSKMNYLIYSLPVTINQYILSKYIFALLNTIISIIISVVLTSIVKLLGYSDVASSMSIYSIVLSMSIIGLFYITIVQPATLLLGSEKSRYILLFLAIIPVTFSGALIDIFSLITISISSNMIVILIALTLLLLLLGSYFITCNRFSKKEIY